MQGYVGKFAVLFTLVLAAAAVLVWRWPPAAGVDLRGGVALTYAVAEGQRPSDEPMDRLIAALGRRVDPGRIKEVAIQRLGADRVRITLSRTDAAELGRLEKIISSPGTLEFRILANNHDHRALIERARKEDSPALLDALGNREAWWVPVAQAAEKEVTTYPEIATRTVDRGPTGKMGTGSEQVAPSATGTGSGEVPVPISSGEKTLEVLVVPDRYNVNESYLTQTRTGEDAEGRPCVYFGLDATGARRMAQLTGEHLPDQVQKFSRRLGSILNGHLISAPPIENTIREQGQITGDFSQSQVEDLVDVLNAGRLPVLLAREPVERVEIGPTLGSGAAARVGIGGLVSLAVVLALLVLGYGLAGMVGALAVLLTALWLVATMTLVRAPLTLSSLAGVGLALAMAVDANVLVLERLREEIHDRQSALRTAIRNAFDRARPEVLDGHLALVIIASILFLVGTEQVRGFAVALWLGTAFNLVAVLFAARTVFDAAEGNRWAGTLRFREFLGSREINVLRRPWLAGAISLVLIAGGVAAGIGRGERLLSGDLVGGVVAKSGQVDPAPASTADSASTIGPAVAEPTQQRAAVGVVVALLTAFGYLWARFRRPYFGVAIIAGVVHDGLLLAAAVAIGAYLAGVVGVPLANSLAIGVPVLAAMAAVLGYSLYDKIVLFDRIGEARGKSPALTAAMINSGISQSFRRVRFTFVASILVALILGAAGGPALWGPALALLAGLVIARYGSLFIAPSLLLTMAQDAGSPPGR